MEPPKRKRAPGRPKATDAQMPLRAKILSTASQMFMEHGYEPVSLNMIAESAGVTKASLYYYFPNKAALFTTAIAEMMKRISSATAKILDQPGDLRTRIEHLAIRKMSQSH